MSRWLLLSFIVAAGCSKSAGSQNQERGTKVAEDKIDVPGTTLPATGSPEGAPSMGGAPQGGTEGATMGGAGNAPRGATVGASDDQFKLKPEEGKLVIEPPADAKAGAEVAAKIVVTPGSGFHINKEFPTKLVLTKVDGVTLAKEQLIAGGHAGGKGDADAFDDNQLAFSVKLTPTAGNHTINGVFKFAVCDKDSCLAKKEAISIVVAAK